MNIAEKALAECDAEPIHIPGVIQRNGALLGFDKQALTLDYVSDNAEAFLGKSPDELFGTHAESLFGKTLTHTLRNVLQMPNATERRVPIGCLKTEHQSLELHAFLSGDHVVVELEPMVDVPWSESDISARIADLFQQVNAQASVDALLRASVRWLEILSGFDRVMIYRFKEDWSGEVVAESNSSEHDNFLNLCFPKWDIPTQVREIMLRLPLRMITDARAEPVKISAANSDLPPLDIFAAHLRGVSPIHLTYLHNMGVQATMTLSIIVEGKLWGIISFHHYDTMVPSPRFRAIATPFIEYFNVKLTQLIQAEAAATRDRARQILDDIRKHHGEGAELSEIVAGNPMPLMEQFDAQGMAVRLNNEWHAFGRTVPARISDPLIAKAQVVGGVAASDHISAELQEPAWAEEKLAGAMAISLGGITSQSSFATKSKPRLNGREGLRKRLNATETPIALAPADPSICILKR